MRFTVTWTPMAQHQLTELWLRLPQDERTSLSQRVDWLDRELKRFADQKGVPLAGERHLRFLAPPEFFEAPTVGVVYSVSEADCIVEVLEMHVIEQRPN